MSSGETYNREIFHGGDLTWAKNRYGSDGEKWIDLSTGINPEPYPVPSFENAIWQRLPGAEQENTLLVAAQKYYGFPANSKIVAAPGTQSLLQILPYLYTNLTVGIKSPAYAEHAHCWKAAGHTVVEFSKIESWPQNADVIVIISPNNPTCEFADLSALKVIREKLAKKNGLLVIDEAFMDMTPDQSFSGKTSPENTIILKSFGKFFGLAGLRLGFATGDPKLIVTLRDYLGPWAVSGIAAELGITAFNDKDWVLKTRMALAEKTNRLQSVFSKFDLTVQGSTDLFTYVSLEKADRLFHHLCEQHILIRPFQKLPNNLRFGLPNTEDEWARLSHALSTFI